MASPTTTQVAQWECIVKLDDNGTTPTLSDISGVHTKTSIKLGMESKETPVHASHAPIVTQRKTATGFDFEVGMSTSTLEGSEIVLGWYYGSTLFGAAKTIEVYIPDTTTGSRKWTGEVKLSKPPEFDTDASKADMMIMKFSVMEDGAGALTYTVIA
jgi:hypothetical protein